MHENPADPILEAVRTIARRRPRALAASTRYHETTGRALALDLQFTPDGETRMLLRVIAVDRGDCAELLAHLFCGPPEETDVEAYMWEAEERARG